jgi:hypothetical protein
MDYPKIILIPLLVGALTALVKIVDAVAKHELSWQTFIAYGGMPSFHTSFVVSLMTVLGLSEGVSSAAFAIAAVFSLIVIRDAMGFRRYIGAQARVVNILAARVEGDTAKAEKLEERVGHSFWEVIAGALLGSLVSFALYMVLP